MSSGAKVSGGAAVPGGMDKITGINTTALDGIQTNLRKLHEAAHKIASAPARGAEPVEVVEPLVDMIEAQRAIEASAIVLRRANVALDSVLESLRS
jgi:flagellar basal body rod protein FlgC